jgi:hypothetical protein
MRNDPSAILDTFQNDERLDERWREKSLHSMRASLARKRTAWGIMTERIKEAFNRKRENARS